MPRLHLLNKSPDHPRFVRCLACVGADDTLVLMENAVLAMAGDQVPKAIRTLALAEDLGARGLASGAVASISMAQLVALTETHETVISW